MDDHTLSPLPEFLQHLNPQQQLAVRHGTSPLLIVAGAGTGKTTTLAHRVAWQIVSGVPPERILLLTFTRRAASEMLRRVEAILSDLDSADFAEPRFAQRQSLRRIRGGTFHAVATGLLRHYGPLIGLAPDFTILDRSDSEDFVNLIRTRLRLAQSGSRFPLKGTCTDIYSRCVNTQQPLETVLAKWFPWCVEHQDQLAELFTVYVEQKEAQRVLDFDDLLLFWKALSEDERGGRVLREQFDRILVDEYQDTNVLQAQILRALAPDGTGLTVVGDDAQSIYSFRAATVRNILEFPESFPGTTLISLEQNYRSTQRILDLTNDVIQEAAERHHKQLWSELGAGDYPVLVTCADEDTQNDYLIEQILERRESGIPLRRQAVLFRASHHSMSLEAELGRRRIPFRKYGGLRFLETAHIKDLMSFLRLAENPRDTVAGVRVLGLLPGIGPAKAAKLMDELRENGGQIDAWSSWNPPAAAREDWPKFVRLMRQLIRTSSGEDSGPATDVRAVRTFYVPFLKAKYDNVAPRVNDLEQLEAIAGRYRERREFLTEMTLDPPSSTQDLPGEAWQDEDWLVLSTIHSAKGLEWDSVHVIHAADGSIPSDMATGRPEDIEEERRLFYVALTRAERCLHVIRPERAYFRNRRRADQYSITQVTRFLPQAAQSRMNRISFGDVLSGGGCAGTESLIQGDTTEIRRRIAKLWG